MTLDGHRLRETWSDALNDALTAFRNHLTSSQNASWKKVPVIHRDNSTNGFKGKSRAVLRPEPRNVFVSRKTTKSGDLYRAILDFPLLDDNVDLEAWKSIVVTPELRQEWDPSVESSRILETYDPSTRIVKTKFTLGWPANPRDAVTISRTYSDSTTLIDVSTSLPRSPDEPAYLRPSPPYVRSYVNLFSWCIQVLRTESQCKRVRITCFWQHDLRTVWNIGTAYSIPQQLAVMIISLVDSVKNRHMKTPVLSGYGFGVSIERAAFDAGRNALTLDYSIVPDEQEDVTAMHGFDELQVLKEQRRLRRGVEIVLPSSDGWDIRVTLRASSEAVAQLPWTTLACRSGNKVCFQIKHASLIDDHAIPKVKLVLEYSGGLKGLRLNGLPHTIVNRLDHELGLLKVSEELLQDASSSAGISLHASNSVGTGESDASTNSSVTRPPINHTTTSTPSAPRGPAFDKSILARVRRNYIYFSSLLQEPDAKWKQNTEARGVSVTQLDSIDPTLVVYKAEATFVGVGLWDLFSTVATPGVRAHWDKQYDDATLLEDVNELSELWHYKTKPAWPVTGRDTVVIKTVYKSPTVVHVFAFSMDDTFLFPLIPVPDANTIRTQVDLQGWAIEALSPNTTQLTLLEQSDPKGWTGKGTLPQQMIAAVAGIGEFAIRLGGPPMLNRLWGARTLSQKYDHERGIFRVEYEHATDRRASSVDTSMPRHERRDSIDSIQTLGIIKPQKSGNSMSAPIECELRCDIDTWATSFDIVIDPPPQSISCLRRHRLSAGGGGLWLTICHDFSFYNEERLLAIVRRAPLTGKDKGVVMVNGKRIVVDVEELPESEVKSLVKQKRVKPLRIPLDQPPVMTVIRKRRMEQEETANTGSNEVASDVPSMTEKKQSLPNQPPFAPSNPSPLSNFFTSAMEQFTNTTQQAVAAFSSPIVPSGNAADFPAGKKPVHFALDALTFAQGYNRGIYIDNWAVMSNKGFTIQRRVSPEISPTVAVYKGEKIIEGVTAEEVASVVFSYDCRKKWDVYFASVKVLEEYGGNCHTAFLVSKCSFPFKDRGMFVSSLIAREDRSVPLNGNSLGQSGPQNPSQVPNAIYCVLASFDPEATKHFDPGKYNPSLLPIGRIYIDAWILETLDPYTTDKYAIPSTKCTRLVAVDFAGSVPIAVNSMINSALPRAVFAVESYMKGISPYPEIRIPPVGFLLSGEPLDTMDCMWAFRRNNATVLLNSKLMLDSQTYQANVLVSFDRTSFESSETDGEAKRSSHLASTSLSGASASDYREGSQDNGEGGDSQGSSQHRGVNSIASNPPAKSDPRARRSSASMILAVGRDSRVHHTLSLDYVVAELLLDLRMYPDGYEVRLMSRSEPYGGPQKFLYLSLLENGPLPLAHADEHHSFLPIAHTVSVLPPSPLYVQNAGTESPSRHLLRLSLPTSQYELPAVEDPLTGETRRAPPKPQWYMDLEGGRRAVVQIEIRPLATEKRKKGKKVVVVNGSVASIGNEKDVLKMGSSQDNASAGVLSRSPAQEGTDRVALPPRLSIPLAIDDTLCDLGVVEAGAYTSGPSAEPGEPLRKEGTDEESPKNTLTDSPGQITPSDNRSEILTDDTNRGFFGLLGTYQQRLSMLKLGSSGSVYNRPSVKVPGSYPSPICTPSEKSSKPPSIPSISSVIPDSQMRSSSSSRLSVVRSATQLRFSISALVAAVLIAFLVGSLLRSLLSPADFIYVVTDLNDVPGGIRQGPGGSLRKFEPGWREMKRLVELKYVLGGWDFQIAAVRRH